jgi:hypothetical protein
MVKRIYDYLYGINTKILNEILMDTVGFFLAPFIAMLLLMGTSTISVGMVPIVGWVPAIITGIISVLVFLVLLLFCIPLGCIQVYKIYQKNKTRKDVH